MALLQTMSDLSWTVRCWNASNQYRWLYVFSRKGTVHWKDEFNGMTGNGSWKIKGDKLYTHWYNSATVETWNIPIDTKNWTGSCMMKGAAYSLQAIARNFVEVDTDTKYSRTPESKAQFLEKCSQASGRVQVAQLRFSAWLSSISIAYADAFEAHNRFLGEISATQQLAQEMLLGFALAFLGGGVGGVVGAAMKAAEANDFMIDGIKDLAKFSVRGPTSAVFRASTLKGMPSSPLQWQNRINEKVASEMALVAEQIGEWRKAVADDNENFNAGFDPVAEVDQDLAIRNNGVVINFRMLPSFEKATIQRNFEKGWLVAWIKTRAEDDVSGIPGVRASIADRLRAEGKRLGVADIDALVKKHVPIDYDPNWSATGY